MSPVYNANAMRGRRKRPPLPFEVLTINDDLDYYSGKIVGVTFKSAINSDFYKDLTRTMIIQKFHEELFLRKIHLSWSNYEFKTWIDVSSNLQDWFSFRRSHLNAVKTYAKVSYDLNNKFDSNAIGVYLNDFNGRFVDVGFLPKDHAAIIKENYKRWTLLGIDREKRGMEVHLLLSKTIELFKELAEKVMEKKKNLSDFEKIKFLSLKDARKKLGVG